MPSAPTIIFAGVSLHGVVGCWELFADCVVVHVYSACRVQKTVPRAPRDVIVMSHVSIRAKFGNCGVRPQTSWDLQYMNGRTYSNQCCFIFDLSSRLHRHATTRQAQTVSFVVSFLKAALHDIHQHAKTFQLAPITRQLPSGHTMSDWFKLYSAALDIRDAREQAHKPYIDACKRSPRLRHHYLANIAKTQG